MRFQANVVVSKYRSIIHPLLGGEGRGEGEIVKSVAPRLLILLASFAFAFCASAEIPGEFRPQPVLHPTEKCGATGDVVEPPDEFPVSRAPLVNTVRRKPKLTNRGQPTLQGSDLVFNAGWELIEAPKLHADGSTLSHPGVD